MNRVNRFGMAAFEPPSDGPARLPGPMSATVRETAETIAASVATRETQRRLNLRDAKAWRAARDAGRLLERLPLGAVATDAMARDRMDLAAAARSDDMAELRASIRALGQREPIEVWRAGEGYQLRTGWRRLTALRQLHAETGDHRFAGVLARVAPCDDRLGRYADMVAANVLRTDLSFAEMAQVAIAAAQDTAIAGDDPAEMVGKLYGALHKTKRSYIRAFVELLLAVGPALPHPKAVGRNLGVAAARAIRAPGAADRLRAALAGADSVEAQNAALSRAAAGRVAAPAPAVEIRTGSARVTLRGRECRIVGETDYAALPRDRVERAIRAFEAALREDGAAP